MIFFYCSDTLSLASLREVASSGGVVGGTSAGAACQGSGPMIAGGVSYNALMWVLGDIRSSNLQ